MSLRHQKKLEKLFLSIRDKAPMEAALLVECLEDNLKIGIDQLIFSDNKETVAFIQGQLRLLKQLLGNFGSDFVTSLGDVHGRSNKKID